jgi:hypothetical protein
MMLSKFLYFDWLIIHQFGANLVLLCEFRLVEPSLAQNSVLAINILIYLWINFHTTLAKFQLILWNNVFFHTLIVSNSLIEIPAILIIIIQASFLLIYRRFLLKNIGSDIGKFFNWVILTVLISIDLKFWNWWLGL